MTLAQKEFGTEANWAASALKLCPERMSAVKRSASADKLCHHAQAVAILSLPFKKLSCPIRHC